MLPRVRIEWRDVWVGRGRNFAAVCDRQISDRALHRQEQRRIELRRCWRHRDRAAMGVLLRADFSSRRGVHPRLCRVARFAQAERRRISRGPAGIGQTHFAFGAIIVVVTRASWLVIRES